MAYKIKNFEALAQDEKRRVVLSIAEEGLQAIDTRNYVSQNVSFKNDVLYVKGSAFSLNTSQRVFIIGVGKNAAESSIVFEEILGERISGGIVLDIDFVEEPKKLKIFHGTHPFPSSANREATQAIVSLLKDLNENDCVIFLISGGGTVLLSLGGISVSDESDVIRALFKKGANIEELNIVRKHLSIARGGFLAQYAYPAKVISLISSDVPGNDLGTIASGPTVKDETTISSAKEVLKKYALSEIISTLSFTETPKDNMYFKNISNILFMSNMVALKAMEKKAKEFRLTSRIVTSALKGEASQVGEGIAKSIRNLPTASVLLYGGETTVTLSEHHGEGGRNQELALGALEYMDELSVIVAINSDGRDNTAYAGALCDMMTIKKAQTLGLKPESFLSSHSSRAFWEKTGDFINTGATGSNLSDFVIALKY